MSVFYQKNERIAGEEFEDEVVLIDVDKGLYFSLQGAAKDIWHAFTEARLTQTVVKAFVTQVADADAKAVDDVVEQMKQHEILIPATVAAGSGVAALSFGNIAFAAPMLQSFSDLAELIAIDPVHEVDAEMGWPLRPANFPEAG